MARYMEKLRSESGHTLVELLIATVVFTIAIMASYSVAIMGQGMMSRSSVMTEVQQEALVATKRIQQRLRESSAEELMVMSSQNWDMFRQGESGQGDVLVFGSPRGEENKFHIASEQVEPRWKKLMIYYVDSEMNMLREYEYTPWWYSDSPGAEPYGLDDEYVAQEVLQLATWLVGDGRGEGKPVIRQLASYNIGEPPVRFHLNANFPALLEVTILTHTEAGMGSDSAMELNTSIRLRN